jgi:hypothetical protein
MKGHNLHRLFLQLEKKNHDTATAVVNNHCYWSGDREEFIGDLDNSSNVFEDWRYAHEKSLLCASADSLLVLADASGSLSSSAFQASAVRSVTVIMDLTIRQPKWPYKISGYG